MNRRPPDERTGDMFGAPPPRPPKRTPPPKKPPPPKRTPRKAIARSTDPDTAHMAAASLTPKRLSELDGRILEDIKLHGGSTSLEISDRTGIQRVSVSPRLRPMADAGWLEMTTEKRRGRTGSYSRVWRAL